MIQIKLDYIKAVNYALFHNGIQICNTLEVKNNSDAELRDLQIICEGDFINSYQSPVLPHLAPGTTYRMKEVEIKPLAEKLLELTERIRTSFHVSVCAEDIVVGEQEFELELMPYDHWLGTSILPQTLASFVTPNSPAISNIAVQSAATLKELCGKSAFTAYQSGNPNDVRFQVAAIFATLHRQGIIYRSMPASFEEIGQRITLPEQQLEGKLGNCIELTLLMASVLESVGINSGIVLEKGHAYLAVWLVDDSCPQSICDDSSYLEKKCSIGISEMLVLECTELTSEESSFEQSLQSAAKRLATPGAFDMMIDVLRCRLERFLPLPSRILANGQWTVSQGVGHDVCVVDVREHDRYDLSCLNDRNQEITKFDIWDRKLLDLSLRNSLLNLNLRRRAVQFISFEVNRIEDHLQDGEEYCLLPKIDIQTKLEENERVHRSKLLEPYHELIHNDIEHHRLHTYLTETETLATLKNIYRTARTSIEETGANSLYLAIGVLRWYENANSEIPRFAPLLLLPVEMVYKKGGYYIRTRDEDITLNITLVEFLRQVHNINISGIEPLPRDASGVDVPLIFAAVREALKEQKRWDIEEECILGTFSFSKFLMWNDVHNNRKALLQNDIISSLVSSKLTYQPPTMQDDLRQYDSTTPPTDLALPVAADSSQMAAILEAGKGHSFILYGPPGTGKSQTITNLIANALFQGKRVLFVAEKMAALSVVQKRLEKIGLAPFCLELHSNKSTKRHVLEQLEKALKVTHIVAPQEYKALAEKIFERRKELISYINALHHVDPTDGLSLHDCLMQYESIEGEPLHTFKENEALTKTLLDEGVTGVRDMLDARLETLLKLVGQPSQHPLNGLQVDKASVASPDALSAQLAEAAKFLAALNGRRKELDLTIALRDKLLQHSQPGILQLNASQQWEEWRTVKAKWFLPRYFAKKKFMDALHIHNKYILENEVDGFLERLQTYQKQHTDIEDSRALLQKYFNISGTEDQLADEETLTHAIGKLQQWAMHTDKVRDWLHWSEYRHELRQKGLRCAIEAIEQQAFTATQLRNAFLKALFRKKAERTMAAHPMLNTFEGMIFDERVSHYRRMADEFQLLTQKELYARLAANVPRIADNLDASSEIGLLNRNICNGGRGTALRDLLDHIPTLLPRLCPVMLMSPMSVAQYLSLQSEKIDLVVFDEASQMPTSEAVGAIARGKALIVVGDPKQMPPTSFFSSNNVEEEEAAIDDMESILEDCRTLEIPSLQLNWHYRSRHESLIAFSNNEYYDGQLITFPSVDDQQAKVSLVPVSGYYDKGNKRTNKNEAEAIVNEIVRRLRDEKLRRSSIGVIAFSIVQQGLIEDMLQDVLEKDKQLKEYADSMYEPIFIKNLENAQGDERDVILFSIGYGPDKDGKVSMNFGPLNNAGGERRLNVAVSRARQEMQVFSTLRASQIDLRRTNSKGVEGLKHFLEYAETQSLPYNSTSRGQVQASVIAQQIAEEMTKLGFVAKTNVGRSQFKVDVALSDPATPTVYQLGILLDGEGYHRTQTTRDREIVQPSVLTGLGWKLMRVWSVDWFNNRPRVIQRILEMVNAKPDNAPEPPTPKSSGFTISAEDQIELPPLHDTTYQEYTATKTELKRMDNLQLAQAIVAKEQPITFMQLCRRISALRELGRVTATLQRELYPMAECNFYTQKDRESKVLWISAEACQQYKGYRLSGERDIADVPMVEICGAIHEAIDQQIAINEESLKLITAKKLGFTRRGTNLEAAISEGIRQMLAVGKIEKFEGKLRFKI